MDYQEQPIRDKKALLYLYDRVLPALAKHVHENLAEIIPLFHDFKLERIVDTWPKGSLATSQEEISIDNGNVQRMGLRLQLEGFWKAGANTFDYTKDLTLQLNHNDYEAHADPNMVLLHKTYLQEWTKPELSETAEKWCEHLIEGITEKLQQLQ